VREEREAELKARRATAVRAPFRHSCAFVCRDEYLEEANASTMIRLAIWPPLRINTCRTLSTLNTSSSGVTRTFGYKTTYGRWTPTIVVGSPTAPPPRRPITHLSALACRTRTLTRPSAPTASAPPPNSLSTSLGSLSSSSSSPLASFIPIRTCLNVARHAGSSIPYPLPASMTDPASTSPTEFRLPKDVHPTHYDVTIRTDLVKQTFDGFVVAQ
jgi:hypothetical protein